MTSPLLDNLLLFGRTLRYAGLPVSPGQTMDFLRALDMVDVGDRGQVFHAARSLLVTRREDLNLFEAIFHHFWRSRHEPRGQPRRRPKPQPPSPGRPFDVVTYMAYKARQSDRDIDVADKAGTYSAEEVLHRKEFSDMNAEELEAVKRLIRELRFAPSLRKTRRQAPDPKGARLDLRRCLRQAVKYGGAVVELPRRSVKVKQRPVVFLADVSGSMEKTSRLVLQLFYSMTHSLRDVESFVFGTRLTRVTPQIRLRNVDQAVDGAAREVIDWAAGTRIGACLGDFNRRFSRRVLRRGAVVLIVSDGWERGDVSALRREMRYLRHRCHRLVWLNPLSGTTSYEPRVEGMAAAMPWVDDFLPIHNLESLDQLARHLGSLPAR